MLWNRPWLALVMFGVLVMLPLGAVGIAGSPTQSAAAAAWLTALTAIGAALIGLRQLRHVMQTHDERNRPFVVVDLVPERDHPEILYLTVTSIGLTPAYNVTFNVSPPFRVPADAHGHPLMAVRWLAEGIPVMPPGREYRALYGTGPELKSDGLSHRHDVTASYLDRAGHRFQTTQAVDALLSLNALYVRRKTTHDVAEELKRIREALR